LPLYEGNFEGKEEALPRHCQGTLLREPEQSILTSGHYLLGKKLVNKGDLTDYLTNMEKGTIFSS